MTAELNPVFFWPAFSPPARARMDHRIVRKPGGRNPRLRPLGREVQRRHIALQRQSVGDRAKVLFRAVAAPPLKPGDAIKLPRPPPVQGFARAVGATDMRAAERRNPAPAIAVAEFKRVIKPFPAQTANR